MFKSIFKSAIGLLILDKGLVFAIALFNIAMQMTFVKIPESLNDPVVVNDFARSAMMIVLFNIVSDSAILYRLYSLSQGIKNDLTRCFWQAIKTLPSLLFLYFIATTILIFTLVPGIKLIDIVKVNFATQTGVLFAKAIFLGTAFLLFSLLPYLLAVFVVAREQSVFRAFSSLAKFIKYKVDGKTMASISMMYTSTLMVNLFIPMPEYFRTPVSILSALWLIFCHANVLSLLYLTDTKKDIIDKKSSEIVV